MLFPLCNLSVLVHLNQELAAVSVELPDALKSLQLCKLKENEVIFLEDVKKTLGKPHVTKQVSVLCAIVCLNYGTAIFSLTKTLVMLLSVLFSLLEPF